MICSSSGPLAMDAASSAPPSRATHSHGPPGTPGPRCSACCWRPRWNCCCVMGVRGLVLGCSGRRRCRCWSRRKRTGWRGSGHTWTSCHRHRSPHRAGRHPGRWPAPSPPLRFRECSAGEPQATSGAHQRPAGRRWARGRRARIDEAQPPSPGNASRWWRTV